MNRYKKQGWFGESHRHYLASKGIRTSDKYSRLEMLRKVSDLQEFKEDNIDVSTLNDEELGGILGYWQVGDGESQRIFKKKEDII